MLVEQSNIYDFLDKHEDQLYEKLKNLQKGDTITIESYSVHLNRFGLYEVFNDETDTVFSSLESCYKMLYFYLSCLI